MSTGAHDAMTNGAVPRAPLEGETTRITRTAIKASGMSADELIEALASRIESRATGHGNGNGGGSGRKVLGIEVAAIGRWFLGAVTGAALFLFTWYQTVNRGLEDRPTRDEVKKVNGEIDARMGSRIGAVEKEVQAVRESQIRTEEQIGNMNEVLREIRITSRRR